MRRPHNLDTTARAERRQRARASFQWVAYAQAKRVLTQAFDLQQLEARQLLTTASVDANHVLQIVGTSAAETITVNRLSSGQVSVSGVTPRFNPGSGAGQFNQIRIDAGGGSDTIAISSNVVYNASTILAGTGNDTVTGGTGRDQVSAGDGNDRIDGGSGSGAADSLNGGAGFDTANYSSRTDSLRISLNDSTGDGANNGAEGDDVDTEEVITGAGNDNIVGGANDDFAGGGAGNDTMHGSDGADVLTGSTGADQIFGEAGNDQMYVMNNDRDTVNGGDGTDSASIDTIDVPSIAGFIGPVQRTAVVEGVPGTPGEADLDPSFADNGKLLSTLGWNRVNAVTVDSKGRIIYVGNVNGDGSEGDVAVARFTADGAPDESFGPGGETSVDFSTLVGAGYATDDTGDGVTVDANDNVIVVGSTRTDFGDSGFGDSDFAVARLLADTGELDPAFGSNGERRVNIGGGYGSAEDFATDVVVQRNGAVVVVGNSDQGTGFAATRLSSTGGVDDSFGNGGTIFVPLPGFFANATSVALQTLSVDEGGQRIVIGGSVDRSDSFDDLALVRLTTGGQLDSTFGAGYGFDIEDLGGRSDVLNDIAVNAANAIVGVGSTVTPITRPGGAAVVDGTLPDGAVIAEWNSGGAFITSATDNTNGLQEYRAVAIDGVGSILAAGRAQNDSGNSDFAVGRYDSKTLTFDPTFADGPVVVDLTPAAVDQNLFDDAFGVFALPDGKILAGGVHNNPDESNSPAAIRLFGRSIEGNGDNPPDVVIDVENPNLSYEDVQNMTFPGLSRDAAFYIKSQPNPLGQVTLNLGDGNDVVNFFMTKDANGKDVIAVDVNGIVLYYDPAKMRLFTILGHGGNDKILGSDSITVPMVVDGGAGNDTEIGGGGNDLFTEGLHAPGTATLFDDGHEEHDDDDCDSHGDGGDLIKGGAGVDTMDYSSRTTNINVGLGTTADDGAPDEHDNVWMDVENVKTGSGNDIIRGQHNPGGNVDNTFDAGAGNDILIGMDGNDHLLGGPGRDILFGGNGADNLEGGTEDDILASGPTKYDLDNQSALAKIQKEWTSTSTSYANRVLHIRNGSGGLNGSNKLKAGSTALNDTSIDQLTGGAGQDWFFADTTGGDVVTDRNTGGAEVVDEL